MHPSCLLQKFTNNIFVRTTTGGFSSSTSLVLYQRRKFDEWSGHPDIHMKWLRTQTNLKTFKLLLSELLGHTKILANQLFDPLYTQGVVC